MNRVSKTIDQKRKIREAYFIVWKIDWEPKGQGESQELSRRFEKTPKKILKK